MFSEPFMQKALVSGIVAAAGCGYLGIFVIWRRIVFLSVALSEVAALGVAAGLFLGVAPALPAFLLTGTVTLILWKTLEGQRVFSEAVVGFIYAFAAASSVLLIAKNPLAEAHGIDLLSGNILYVSTADVIIMATVISVVLLCQIIFQKEFIAVTLDPEFTFTLGTPVALWNFVFFACLGIVIGLTMKNCGLLFVFSSLIIPPLTGLWLTVRIRQSILVSVVTSLVCVISGLAASWRFDLPSGPTIVVFYGICFFLAVLVSLWK